MHKTQRVGIGMLAAVMLFSSGCYGPFLLTKKVHKWNGEISDNKWVVEVAFLVCAWLPVYGIATLADAVIFNSVEFWTGQNPLAKADAAGVTTKRIVRKDGEVILQRMTTPDGDQLVIEQFQHGQRGPSLHIRHQGDATVALNGDGAVLFRARTLADGRVELRGTDGQVVATYSKDQAKQLLASLPQ